mmetsp:Transcript_109399/g.309499  ORF Transcript_109399/g.309499 Transcript_109399/m.309499 type:complete len:216 (-) Transcript_109399:1070-1717(-)
MLHGGAWKGSSGREGRRPWPRTQTGPSARELGLSSVRPTARSSAASAASRYVAPREASPRQGHNSSSGTSRRRAGAQSHISKARPCMLASAPAPAAAAPGDGRKRSRLTVGPRREAVEVTQATSERSMKRLRCRTRSPGRTRCRHSAVKSSMKASPWPPAKLPSWLFRTGRRICMILPSFAQVGCMRTSSGISFVFSRNCTTSFEKWLQFFVRTS